MIRPCVCATRNAASDAYALFNTKTNCITMKSAEKSPRVYRVRVDSLSPLRRSASGLAMWTYVPVDLSSSIEKVANYSHADRGSSSAAWEFHGAWQSQCARLAAPPYHSGHDRNLMHWFTCVLSEGDTVIAVDVTQRWFVGRVSGGYRFNGRGRWPHRRQIDWLPDTLQAECLRSAFMSHIPTRAVQEVSEACGWLDDEALAYFEQCAGIRLGSSLPAISFYPPSRHMPDHGTAYRAFKHFGFIPIPQDQSGTTHSRRDSGPKVDLMLSKFEVKVEAPDGFEWLVTLRASTRRNAEVMAAAQVCGKALDSRQLRLD